MTDPWKTLSLVPNPAAVPEAVWRGRLPSLPDARQRGETQYAFFPGLNVGLRRLNGPALRFVDAHFLTARPRTRRWLWRGALQAARLRPGQLVPAHLRADLTGDVVLLGPALVEFDLAAECIRKHYREDAGERLRRSRDALRGTPLEFELQTAPGGYRVQEPLRPGAPLGPYAPGRARWSRYLAALGVLRRLRSPACGEVPTAGYAQQLATALPDWIRGAYVRALLESLQKHDAPLSLALSHGDLKDENILGDGPRTYVVDWELADLRSTYHDAFNLLVHPVVCHRLNRAGLREHLAGVTARQRLAQLVWRTDGARLDERALGAHFRVVLLEKLAIYANSGRWDDCLAQCVRDWRWAVQVLDAELRLGACPR